MSKDVCLNLDDNNDCECELYNRNEEDKRILLEELKKGNFNYIKVLEDKRIDKNTLNFWTCCLSTNFKEDESKKLLHKFQFEWRKMAADLGDPFSMYVVSIAYIRGYPINQDAKLGYHYALEGSNHGEHMATFVEGMLKEEGFGCKKDIHEALELYNDASDHGVIGAMLRVNAIYKEGKEDIKKDEFKANKYIITDAL